MVLCLYIYKDLLTNFFVLFFRHMVEIAGGLGPTAGKVWRVGVMGINATPDNIDFVLKVLKEAIENSKV